MDEFNVEKLLLEFKENREYLKKMIQEIEVFKDKLDIVFPEKFDNRYRKFFEEKIKAITNFFSTLLDVRKEIGKSLKEEVEMRRKIDKTEDDIEKEIDIRELATKIEMMNKGEYLNVTN